MINKNTHFIVITGGVVSGVGKGVAAASIGFLLGHKLKIIPIKCDGYLNTDPGTMNPIEHGEVFVLDDGGEVDMDFGHYERFLNISTQSDWSITMGKVFKTILEKERSGHYLGKTVQFIPHVTDEIKNMIYHTANREKADIVLLEIGGTIGDMENRFFIEAVRQIRHEIGYEKVMFSHVTYVPALMNDKDQKSKPTQQSVKILNESGIYPDIIIARSKKSLDKEVIDKIALHCNINKEAIFSAIDVDYIYELPLLLEEQGISEFIHKRINVYSPPYLHNYTSLIETLKKQKKNPSKIVRVLICGKYTTVQDSYVSISETLKHVSAHLDIKIVEKILDTVQFEKEDGEEKIIEIMSKQDAIIVPGGFGERGIEGKIKVIRYARENNIPFFGICLGMQLAVIEFARHKCNLTEANTKEINEATKHPLIITLPGQKELKNTGSSMRLGGNNVVIKDKTKAYDIYKNFFLTNKNNVIRERFRHRYEVNPNYIEILEKNGLIFSGYSEEENIMQLLEIKTHPFFMACQFHPELISNLDNPSPLFFQLIKSCINIGRFDDNQS